MMLPKWSIFDMFIQHKRRRNGLVPAKKKEDYSSALKRLEVLIDARRSDAQQNEFLLLTYLVEEYEEQNLPIRMLLHSKFSNS
jgi:hypothetical protein